MAINRAISGVLSANIKKRLVERLRGTLGYTNWWKVRGALGFNNLIFPGFTLSNRNLWKKYGGNR